MGIKNIIAFHAEQPEELSAELKELEQRLRRVGDYHRFDDRSEELDEEELELVTAAGPSVPYAQFLKKLK